MTNHANYLRKHAARSSHAVRARVLQVVEHLVACEIQAQDVEGHVVAYNSLVDRLRSAWESVGKPGPIDPLSFRTNHCFDSIDTPARLANAITEADGLRKCAEDRTERLEKVLRALYATCTDESMQKAIEVMAAVESVSLRDPDAPTCHTCGHTC